MTDDRSRDRTNKDARNTATPREDDPTLVRNQPALTTSTGLLWLVCGAALLVVSLALMIPLALTGDRVTIIGSVAVVVLYAAMIVVRFVIANRRARLTSLAILMIAIGVTAVIVLYLVPYASA